MRTPDVKQSFAIKSLAGGVYLAKVVTADGKVLTGRFIKR